MAVTNYEVRQIEDLWHMLRTSVALFGEKNAFLWKGSSKEYQQMCIRDRIRRLCARTAGNRTGACTAGSDLGTGLCAASCRLCPLRRLGTFIRRADREASPQTEPNAARSQCQHQKGG